LVPVLPDRDEPEPGVGIDESPDEPRAGHAIDVDSRARHPGPPARFLHWGWLFAGLRRRGRREPFRDLRQQAARCLPSPAVEEIDRGNLGRLLLQSREQRFQFDPALVAQLPPARQDASELTGLTGDLLAVRIARGPEHLLELLVGEPFDEARLDQRGVPTPFDDLAQHPVEVLEGLVARGQRVDGVLDPDRAEALEPAPDLHPEVAGLRWDLMDEEQPPRHERVYRTTVSSVNMD